MRENVLKSLQKGITRAALILPGALVFFPVILLLTGSVMDQYELGGYLTSVFMDGTDFIGWKLMPDYPTFENYGKLLFMTPQFFVLFWNSVRMAAGILAMGGKGKGERVTDSPYLQETRLAFNSQRFDYLCLLSAGIKGIYHHTRLK